MHPAEQFNWSVISRALDTANYEEDYETPGAEIARVWLGTVYALTPSGKFYAPFACSNVAGDCPVCGGTGVRREPRTGRRARKRAAARERCRVRLGARAQKPRTPHAKRQRDWALVDHFCPACTEGSISAARDERWQERLEACALDIDAFVDWQGDDIFLARSRDVTGDVDGDREDAQ